MGNVRRMRGMRRRIGTMRRRRRRRRIGRRRSRLSQHGYESEGVSFAETANSWPISCGDA